MSGVVLVVRRGDNIRGMYEQFVGRNGARPMKSLIDTGCKRDHESAYPVAVPRFHWMFMLSHWGVVGFGNGTVGSFHWKKND